MTAKVITVFNQKGGVGKTNLTMQLAGTIGLMGAKVLVIDLDSQGTAMQWNAMATDEKPFPARVVSMAAAADKAHREISKHLEDYNYIFADCPPSVESPAASSAMLVSDLALIPVVPAPSDVWASQKAKELADQIRALRNDDSLVVRMVPNKVSTVSNLAKETLELLEEDEDCGTTKGRLGLRTAYAECQLYGGTVHALGSSAEKAIAEIDALAEEVLGLLGVKVKTEKRRN